MAKKVTHSKMFDQIKTWYDMGFWSEQRVYNMVEKGVLTTDEYKEITGQEYKA